MIRKILIVLLILAVCGWLQAVHEYMDNKEQNVPMAEYEALKEQLALHQDHLDHIEKRLNTPEVNDSMYLEGMWITLDKHANRIIIFNPKGNIEVFCEEMYVNGRKIE